MLKIYVFIDKLQNDEDQGEIIKNLGRVSNEVDVNNCVLKYF